MQLTRITYSTEEMQADAVEIKNKIIDRTNPEKSMPYLFGERK